MKRLYSLPTDDVILDCLANDVIDRNQDVVRFCSILDSFHECTVISLDGAWGSGKTFFVKQAKMLIDGTTDSSVFKEEIKEGFERVISADDSIYKGFSMTQKHSTVYYDAWENDNDSDPILSIIYAVTKSKQVDLRIHNDRSAVDILSTLAECLTGISIASFTKAILGTDPMGEKKQNESIIDLMHKFFDKAVGRNKERLVIFIDELDRCKPTYAVSLLERIKHYFTDERLTFVFSINQDQLQHTIKGFYGNGMNGSKYLEKLFDLIIPLPNVNHDKYLSSLGLDSSSIYRYDKICLEVIRYFRFDLRDISKYLLLMRSTVYDFVKNKVDSNRLDSESILDFCLLHLTPILIGLRLHDTADYQNFLNGKNSLPLVDILTIPELRIWNQKAFLSNNETFEENVDAAEGKIVVTLRKKLNDLYSYVFIDRIPIGKEKYIGSFVITRNTKSAILEYVNPISKYAKLD